MKNPYFILQDTLNDDQAVSAGSVYLSRQDQAKQLTGQGFKVFPLKPNKKEPLISGWQAQATVDTLPPISLM